MGVSSINIKFAVDLKDFSTQMQNAERQIKKVGNSFNKVGSAFTLGLTAPIAAFGVASVLAFDESAKALAQVEAGIRSTGAAAGYTAEQFTKMAAGLQANSLYDDDDILKNVTAQLLTFTNIVGDSFPRAQQAIIDFAARTNKDLYSVSIMVGKALNDPIKGLTAMGKAGVQFSEEQKAVITSLVETNQVAEAQSLILAELERQYGGSAKAASEAGLGPLTQLKNILGDISEDFGKIIFDSLKPLIENLKRLALGFKELEPGTQKIIVLIGALVAAIGPLLLGIGYLMTNVIPGLVIAFSALARVMPVIIAQFQTLTATMLASPITYVAAAIGALVYGFTVLVQKITPTISKLETLWNMIKSAGDPVRFATLQSKSFADQLSDQAKAQEEANKTASEMNKIMSDLTTGMTAVNAAGPVVVKIRPEVESGISGNTKGLSEIGAGQIAETGFGGVDLLAENLKLSGEEFTDEQERLLQSSIEFGQRLSETIQQAAVDFAGGIGEMVGSLISGDAEFKDAGDRLIAGFANILIQFGKLVIAAGVASEAFAKAILNPFGGGLLAIAAGAALVAVGTAMKNFSSKAATQFADGGIVSGPTYALVGEYPGASNNPEVIAPLSKLKDLIQPNQSVQEVTVNGVFEIDGRKLKLVLDRTNQQYSRLL